MLLIAAILFIKTYINHAAGDLMANNYPDFTGCPNKKGCLFEAAFFVKFDVTLFTFNVAVVALSRSAIVLHLGVAVLAKAMADILPGPEFLVGKIGIVTRVTAFEGILG